MIDKSAKKVIRIKDGKLVEVKVTDIKWNFTKVKEDADENQDASTEAKRSSGEKTPKVS